LRKPVNELCSTCHQNEKDIAKHVQEMAQKHIPDVKVKVTPDMECVPCHMPNHSHRMTNQEAADYMKANKDKLSQ
jgi:formate-dependent nitrite reductase cytochrome c552 subunit